MFYLIAYLDAGMRVYSSSPRRDLLKQVQKRREKRTPAHVCPQFYIVGEEEFKKLKAEQAKKDADRKQERKQRGQERAARTRAKNKELGIHKPYFILCPTCKGKSKKLRSEMGGLQTRVCKKGHLFEVDTFFGFESNKRRIEQFDRPYFSPNGQNYNDWVQGRYKDDPMGKQDMLKEIIERDRRSR